MNPGEFTEGIILGVFSSDPTGLKEGQLYYNSVSGKVRQYNGSTWADISTGGLNAVVDDTTPQLGGDLDINSNDITGTGNINTTGSITVNGDAEFGVSGSVKVLLGNWGGAGLPGMWIGENAAAPDYSNYAILWDNGVGGTIFNAPSGKNMSFRIGNSSKIAIDNATGDVTFTNNVKTTALQPYDATNTAYGTISLNDDVYSFNRTGGTLGQINYNEGSVSVTNIENAFSWKIQGSDSLSANVVLDVPDKSGTIALTDDVAARAKATINVQALTSSPADGATAYFGNMPKAPTTTANISKIYFRESGTITHAEIYNYSGTAGTNEAWSLYIRKNNTTDYLIATVSSATNERVFSNAAMTVPISAGDYVEIKMVNPTWVTNPLTCIFGGYLKLN